MADSDSPPGSPAVTGRKRKRVEMSSDRRAPADREPDLEEEEDGEDLFGDNMADDYRDMGVLDAYDSAMLDDRDFGSMDDDARARAEALMAERDRVQGRFRGSRLGAALESDEEVEEDEDDTGEGFRARRKRRRLAEQAAGEELEEDMDAHEPFALESFAGPVRDWLAKEQTQAEVRRRFRDFLVSYTTGTGHNVHERVIDDMCAASGVSLVISYLHLAHHSPILAVWLADLPAPMLALFNQVARAVVLERYPAYWRVGGDDIVVRIKDLPLLDAIRDLRTSHLNCFIKVSGVVTRRSQVYPQLKRVTYICNKCGEGVGPFYDNGTGDDDGGAAGAASGGTGSGVNFKPATCPSCESRGSLNMDAESTIYGNYQRIFLQESPGTVPPGRVPRSKEIVLRGDLIDAARPGEEIEVTGIYLHQFDPSLNSRQGFPVFSTLIEANYIECKTAASSAANATITEEDRKEIHRLSKHPRILSIIVKSIAPSIYGHEHVKLALALSMFGGLEKNVKDKHRVRGDINVLLLGDPGVAKSQFLKYIEKTAPRAVYTTGKGASAVGLTAAVHKDPLTKEWALEGGALVLADRGICLIDEFDKMNDSDRTSIHEAMEQQSISISKAGIITTLQARCAVMAAANPISGRYDISKTFSENVQLTDPILTRFDILCVVRDEADPLLDEKLATFVVDSHARAHPAKAAEREAAAAAQAAAGDDSSAASAAAAAASSAAAGGAGVAASTGSGADDDDAPPIPQALLKKYIRLAKEVKPSLAGIDQDKVSQLYADLRKESEISGGIPIAVRHIESMIRMAEASARMRHSPVVSEADLNVAIRVMLESFISAQRFSVMRALRRQFSRYLDVGADSRQLCAMKLRDIMREKAALEFVREGDPLAAATAQYDLMEGSGAGVEVRDTELKERLRRHGVDDLAVMEFLRSKALEEAGFVYDPATRVISRR